MNNEAAALKREKRRDFILNDRLLKVIFVVALPQVVNMVIDSIYNIFDAVFVSGLGEAAIAAVGVNDSLMQIIRSISIGFGMGSASYISRSLGAKKDEEASRAAVTTMFTAIVVLSVFATLGFIFIDPLVKLLGATPEMYGYSIEYASWILLSAPITAATICLSQVLRSEGSTTFAMLGTVSGNVLDIFMNYWMIIKMGWGVAGAAISTDIAKLITLIVLLIPFLKRRTIVQLKWSYFTPTKKIYSEISRMGIPTMLRSGMFSVATIFMNNIAVTFGNAAVAALVIANKSLKFIASAIMGFGQGFQPIAGYSYGAKKYDRIIKGYTYTLIIGAVLGLLLGVGLSSFSVPVINIFSKDPEVHSIAFMLILSQSVTMVPHVWVMITTGLFQALGNALRAGGLGLSRQLFILIPCIYILSKLFGVTGLSYAQAAADVLSCILAAVLVIPLLKQLIKLKKGLIKQEPIAVDIDYDELELDD